VISFSRSEPRSAPAIFAWSGFYAESDPITAIEEGSELLLAVPVPFATQKPATAPISRIAKPNSKVARYPAVFGVAVPKKRVHAAFAVKRGRV
jgi:hypothetical protein